MNDLSRRDLLAGIIQALLLALFPWLRVGRGPEIAGRAAKVWLADNVFVLQPGGVAIGNVFTSWAALYEKFTAAKGTKAIVIDDTFAASTPIEAGAYDLTDTTIVAADGHLAVGDGSVEFILGDRQRIVTLREELSARARDVQYAKTKAPT